MSVCFEMKWNSPQAVFRAFSFHSFVQTERRAVKSMLKCRPIEYHIDERIFFDENTLQVLKHLSSRRTEGLYLELKR